MKIPVSLFHRAQALLGAVVLAAAMPAASSAAQLSTTFHVYANVAAQGACTSFSATDINFGTLTGAVGNSGIALPATAAHGVINWACSTNIPVSIALSAGNSAAQSTSATGRTMLNGTAALAYQIYLPLYGNNCGGPLQGVWGDGTSGTLTENYVTTGAQNIYTCAQLPAQNVPTSGSYSDTIVATLTF